MHPLRGISTRSSSLLFFTVLSRPPGRRIWGRYFSGNPGSLHISECDADLEITTKDGTPDTRVEPSANVADAGIPSPAPHHVYVAVVKACMNTKSLHDVRCAHAHLIRHNVELSGLLGEYLVLALVKCGGVDDAIHVFQRLSSRTAISWTAVISGYVDSCKSMEVFKLFECMIEERVQPNQYTYVILIKACGIINDIEKGRELHKTVCEKGLWNAFVASALVSMYGKCRSVHDAEKVFGLFLQLNSVSWNAMLSIYVDQGHSGKALLLFRQMHFEGVSIDGRTYAIILQACACLVDQGNTERKRGNLELLDIIMSLHADAQKKGFDSAAYVGNNLLSIYGKFGRLTEAEHVFRDLCDKNVVSWCIMITSYLDQDHEKNALQLYRKMQEEGIEPDERVFVVALKACGSLSKYDEETKFLSLQIGQAVHADAERKGFASQLFVANTLLSMYSKCGSIGEVECMFGSLKEQNLVTWNVMLSAYIEHGLGEKCLQLYRQMQEDRLKLDEWSYANIFQACCIIAEKERVLEGKSPEVLYRDIVQGLYMEVRREGFLKDAIVGSMLISMYCKFMELEEVECLFDELHKDDVKVWNAMLIAYTEQEKHEKALKLYIRMVDAGVLPDQVSFVTAFQSCFFLAEYEDPINAEGQWVKEHALEITRALHHDVKKRNLVSDSFITNNIVSAYAKCGAVAETEALFHSLRHSAISWNAVLSAYVAEGKGQRALLVYREMLAEGTSPNELTFIMTLQACALFSVQEDNYTDDIMIKQQALDIGRALHADALRKGFISKSFVGNTILSTYCKCRSIQDAEAIFSRLSEHNVVSWSVLMSGYVELGQAGKALQVYSWMQKQGISPDDRTVMFAIQACGSLIDEDEPLIEDNNLNVEIVLEIGHALHADAMKLGFASNVFVENTIVTVYGKCRSICEAEKVFSRMSKHVGSWNAMLSTLLEMREGRKALHLYKDMQECGVNPDKWTLTIVLQACSIVWDEQAAVKDELTKVTVVKVCYSLHVDSVWKGLTDDFLIGNTFISTYSKVGCLNDAFSVLNGLSQVMVSSWNSILAAYVELGQVDQVFELFRHMRKECVPLDNFTFVWVLQACSESGNKDLCWQLHFLIVASETGTDPHLATSLVRAYGSCASTEDSQGVIDLLPQPDVFVYSACIAGYALEGDFHSSCYIFENMQLLGISPNRVTFLSLICAINHSGNVDIGIMLFRCMEEAYGLAPDVKHYATMVELLGRAGNFAKVKKLLEKMPMRGDAVIWSTLLGACFIHGNLELGKQAFQQAVCSDQMDVAAYVFMSNVYAGAHGNSSLYDIADSC